MADYSDITFQATQIDYIAKLNTFRLRAEALATEIENARGGQASVLARIQQCMVMSVGYTQDINLNGYRSRNAPTPIYSDELVNKSYADGLSFAAALPAQAGNAGKEIKTDGTTATWGISGFAAIGVLNSMGF